MGGGKSAAKSRSLDRDGGKKIKRIARMAITAVLAILCAVLLFNAVLIIFMPHYYPTFGNKRYFSVVTDSMQGEINRGCMIVCRVPKAESEIEEGTVITFEVTNDDGSVAMVLTHRVVRIQQTEEGIAYITKGDNAPAEDGYLTPFENVIGVYTGRKMGLLGYLSGFLQSPEGAIFLILSLFLIVMVTLVFGYYNKTEEERKLIKAAMDKSARMLYTNQEPQSNQFVADILYTASAEPETRKDKAKRDKKLSEFVHDGEEEEPVQEKKSKQAKQAKQSRAEQPQAEQNAYAQQQAAQRAAEEAAARARARRAAEQPKIDPTLPFVRPDDPDTVFGAGNDKEFILNSEYVFYEDNANWRDMFTSEPEYTKKYGGWYDTVFVTSTGEEFTIKSKFPFYRGYNG